MSSLLIGSKSDKEINGVTKQVDKTNVASAFYSVLHALLSFPLPQPGPPLQGWLTSMTMSNEGIQNLVGVHSEQHSCIW